VRVGSPVGRSRHSYGGDRFSHQTGPLRLHRHYHHSHRYCQTLPPTRLETPRSAKKMVSDRGPQFVAEFTRELYRMLGVKLAATTAYHPQGDSQTERVNQELEQYLRLFVNQRQDDWADLLPLAEVQYNSHIHSSTQQPPFFLE
jgi:transposase InsO family protein